MPLLITSIQRSDTRRVHPSLSRQHERRGCDTLPFVFDGFRHKHGGVPSPAYSRRKCGGSMGKGDPSLPFSTPCSSPPTLRHREVDYPPFTSVSIQKGGATPSLPAICLRFDTGRWGKPSLPAVGLRCDTGSWGGPPLLTVCLRFDTERLGNPRLHLVHLCLPSPP